MGTVLCGCCGGVLEPEDYTILFTYNLWVNIKPDIVGDNSLEIFRNKKNDR